MGTMDGEEPRVPNRVRELRENKLMTQAQLARKAKVALRTIHSVEKGMNCRMDTPWWSRRSVRSGAAARRATGSGSLSRFPVRLARAPAHRTTHPAVAPDRAPSRARRPIPTKVGSSLSPAQGSTSESRWAHGPRRSDPLGDESTRSIWSAGGKPRSTVREAEFALPSQAPVRENQRDSSYTKVNFRCEISNIARRRARAPIGPPPAAGGRRASVGVEWVFWTDGFESECRARSKGRSASDSNGDSV